MPTLNLGRVRFNWRGDYDPAETYLEYDTVKDDGQSYVAIQDVAPTDPGPNELGGAAFWGGMLVRGADYNAARDQAVQAASDASDSAGAASTSEGNAGDSATEAAGSMEMAERWANELEDVEVAPGEYSAYHWAKKAEAFGDPNEFNFTADLSEDTRTGSEWMAQVLANQQALNSLGDAAGRDVVGGSGPLMAQGYSGIGSTSREIGNGETINLKTLGKGFFFTNRPAADGVTGLPPYIPDVYSLNIPLVGSSPSSIINSVLTILPTLRRIILGVSDGTETGLIPFEVYTAASIVGPVSEEGGVPTGAIIESDSDSFGSWTYFADGTLEMVVNTIHTDVPITTTGATEGSLYRSSELSIPLPKPIAGGSDTGFSIELNNGSGSMIASSIARTRLSGSTLYFTVVAGSSLGANTFSTSAIVKTRWFN